MATTENNPNAETFKQLAAMKAEKRGEKVDEAEELPQGTSAVEASASSAEGEEASTEETPVASEGESVGEEAGEPAAEEEPIRIAGREFKSQKEAFEWAEDQERQRLLTEAHTAGVREALEATRAPVPAAEPEDDFETKFYSNPKEALAQVRAKATEDAVNIMKADVQREKLWNDFLSEYPDVRRQDAERILAENMHTIGKIVDLGVAKKQLAQKVRAEYQEIINLHKPRTVLSAKSQAVSPSGGRPSGVTPAKKEEKILSLAEQMRSMRK